MITWSSVSKTNKFWAIVYNLTAACFPVEAIMTWWWKLIAGFLIFLRMGMMIARIRYCEQYIVNVESFVNTITISIKMFSILVLFLLLDSWFFVVMQLLLLLLLPSIHLGVQKGFVKFVLRHFQFDRLQKYITADIVHICGMLISGLHHQEVTVSIFPWFKHQTCLSCYSGEMLCWSLFVCFCDLAVVRNEVGNV